MRNKIQEKLLTIDANVFYGIVPADDLKELKTWDYIVFGQSKLRKKGNASEDLQEYWYVTIVREDFIPDEDVFGIIEQLESITGLRLADGDMNYEYMTKPNTNLVVEVLELDFTKTKKVVSNG